MIVVVLFWVIQKLTINFSLHNVNQCFISEILSCLITLCGLESYFRYKVYQIYGCLRTKNNIMDLKFQENVKFVNTAGILNFWTDFNSCKEFIFYFYRSAQCKCLISSSLTLFFSWTSSNWIPIRKDNICRMCFKMQFRH